MLGRGTLLCPDLFGQGQDKQDFRVFDLCGNLEFFSQELAGSEGQLQPSLTQRLFEARLGLVTAFDGREPELRDATAATLQTIVAGMSLDNFVVRRHRRALERFADAAAWRSLDVEAAEQALTLAGLPSAVRDDDEAAKRFDLLVLRRQLAQLDGDAVAAERLRATVQAIAAALLGRTAIPSVAEYAVLLEAVAGDAWWADVTLPMLELARLRIRGLVRFVDKTARNPLSTDFEDSSVEAVEITLPGVVPGTNLARFRVKAAAYLREHEDHMALQRLRRNKQLTADDLASLEQMLLASGAGRPGDLDRLAEATGGLGLFVRGLVGLDRQAPNEAFARYLDGTRFTVAQLRLIGMIVDELTKNGVLDPSRLFESPYIDHAPKGPDSFFQDSDVDVIVETLHTIRRTALPLEVA